MHMAALRPSSPVPRKLQQAWLLFAVVGARTTWRLCLLKPELIGFYSISSCLPCSY